MHYFCIIFVCKIMCPFLVHHLHYSGSHQYILRYKADFNSLILFIFFFLVICLCFFVYCNINRIFFTMCKYLFVDIFTFFHKKSFPIVRHVRVFKDHVSHGQCFFMQFFILYFYPFNDINATLFITMKMCSLNSQYSRCY